MLLFCFYSFPAVGSCAFWRLSEVGLSLLSYSDPFLPPSIWTISPAFPSRGCHNPFPNSAADHLSSSHSHFIHALRDLTRERCGTEPSQPHGENKWRVINKLCIKNEMMGRLCAWAHIVWPPLCLGLSPLVTPHRAVTAFNTTDRQTAEQTDAAGALEGVLSMLTAGITG